MRAGGGSENPANREPIAEIPRGDTANVNGAVEAAARAFPTASVAPERLSTQSPSISI
jgi:acyl-CoA reductase-like NAD-dependent aldehyde dehydrogenase